MRNLVWKLLNDVNKYDAIVFNNQNFSFDLTHGKRKRGNPAA